MFLCVLNAHLCRYLPSCVYLFEQQGGAFQCLIRRKWTLERFFSSAVILLDFNNRVFFWKTVYVSNLRPVVAAMLPLAAQIGCRCAAARGVSPWIVPAHLLWFKHLDSCDLYYAAILFVLEVWTVTQHYADSQLNLWSIYSVSDFGDWVSFGFMVSSLPSVCFAVS